MSAAGTESPAKASQASAGRMKIQTSRPTGRKTTMPTAKADRKARREGRVPEASAQAPMYASVKSGAARTSSSAWISVPWPIANWLKVARTAPSMRHGKNRPR